MANLKLKIKAYALGFVGAVIGCLLLVLKVLKRQNLRLKGKLDDAQNRIDEKTEELDRTKSVIDTSNRIQEVKEDVVEELEKTFSDPKNTGSEYNRIIDRWR